MTTGQRIAQKRKEQTLSQEALGESLGISRQAIYKWESDATLPEVEKLVSLSRLFGVSVGWLLGVEKDAATTDGASQEDGAACENEELTETQLRMVEEITARYAAAQAKKSPWGKWDVRILFALCGLLVYVILTVNGKVDRLDEQYTDLQNTIAELPGSITGQVDASLQAQNSLTADYSTDITYLYPESDEVGFSVYAVPKTYTEGMCAEFVVESSKGRGKMGGIPLSNGKFSTILSSQLSDEIRLSVNFITPDGTQKTQLLETFTGLYSATLPEIGSVQETFLRSLQGDLFGDISLPESYAFLANLPKSPVPVSPSGTDLAQPAALTELRVGLFQNQRLLAWGEACDQPSDLNPIPAGATQYYRFSPQTLHVTSGDTLCVAAVATDEYDRNLVLYSSPYAAAYENKEFHFIRRAPLVYGASGDPNGWTY